jgi:hypothetical protein
MKIVDENHAACLTRSERPDSTERLMLDAVACDLRSLYGDAAADLPDDLLALADRIEGRRSSDARAA